MFYKISVRLTVTETQYYKNTQDAGREVEAANIVLCNTTSSPVNMNLSFPPNSGTFLDGAVMFGYVVPANSLVYMPNRKINIDNRILAYASVGDAVTLSMDILGENAGEYSVAP